MARFELFTSALAIGALIAVTQPAHAQSAPAPPVAQQQPDHQEHHPAAEPPLEANAQDPKMMVMQQKMMADMTAADATLDALVARMNSAEGGAKVDAIAALLKTMVQQQRTMHDGMTWMHSPMTMPMGAAPKPANR